MILFKPFHIKIHFPSFSEDNQHRIKAINFFEMLIQIIIVPFFFSLSLAQNIL